ncbi:uncharacterized protein LOC141632991 [Silene latifolia]|uniref:uncharacterized protein LOC141632991 n=1 Tax=Silene latifolia TaxID=37657 RepID=UPI003D785BA9
MECVSTVSFSVIINGTLSREFRPLRGLQQGDPLSPYLFILYVEALSNLMRRVVEDGVLHGVRVSVGAPFVSHLLFAGNSIFFSKATEVEANGISNILRRYESASGHLVNLDKTTMSFSKGVPQNKRSNLATRLGIVEVEDQAWYLRLSIVVGRSKKGLIDIIQYKLSKRLNGWHRKMLSIVVSHFWWSHDEGKKGISWVAWRKLCQPKCVGGMGFHDFKLFNLALLGKQARRLVMDPEI